MRRCFEIYTGKDLFRSSVCSFIKKETTTQVLPYEIIKCTFLLKTVPTAIQNDISKGYYQKGFIICFLRSTYGRFVEFLIETYNKEV